MPSDKTRENRLRRQAKRLRLKLEKSRARKIHGDDLGGYRILDLYRNYVYQGSRYELTLDDVEEILNAEERE